MSRNTIFLLTCHRHTLLDLIEDKLNGMNSLLISGRSIVPCLGSDLLNLAKEASILKHPVYRYSLLQVLNFFFKFV
jgi:hypothetical protein